MYRHIFEVCATLFLLQGALLIPVPVVACVIWYRQERRLKAIEAALGRDKSRRDRTIASLLARLPKLAPLTCAACGGALALDVDSTTCVSCGAHYPPPADYAATISLRRRLQRLTRAALFHWRVAWVLTSVPVRLLFILLVIGEPVILAVFFAGGVTYEHTPFDRLFERLGEQGGLVLMMFCFIAFTVWLTTFLMLQGLARDLRRKLPVFPAAAPADAEATEFSTCRSCGGGIHYARRAFAALCGYCGVANYRARQARRERAAAERARAKTRATLFGAMEIIGEFTGSFAGHQAFLTTLLLICVIWIALTN